jgi:hypothetical protein
MEINGLHIDCIVITAMKRMFPNDDNWDIYCEVFNNEKDANSFYQYCENSPLFKDVNMHYKNF